MEQIWGAARDRASGDEISFRHIGVEMPWESAPGDVCAVGEALGHG